jgi:hypothetical protein
MTYRYAIYNATLDEACSASYRTLMAHCTLFANIGDRYPAVALEIAALIAMRMAMIM